MEKEHLDELTKAVIGAAIAVHRRLGPGLLESAYEACLCFEMVGHGLHVERQKKLPIHYDGIKLDCGYRLDLLVEDQIVVEVKAVDKLTSIPTAQVLTYLKLSGLSVGLLMNFNVRVLPHGLKRVLNRFPE